MAIVLLEQIPLPPSGVPVTRQQQTQFVNNYMKLAPPNLDVMDRKAIRAVALIHSLNIARGVDYRTNHAQLIADAAAYTNGVPLIVADTALTAIEVSNALRADAAMSNNVEALCQEGRDFEALSEDVMDRIISMLEVRIGQ